MKKNKALFISCEGGDGAGKTTLIRNLEHALKAQGHTVVKTREPGGTPLGDQIRHWLLHHDSSISIGSEAELLLFLASRAQHIQDVIKPALDAGHIVLCDRFNDSTVAYQGHARGLGMEHVQRLCDLVCQEIVPDITFYLDIDPQIGLKRAGRADQRDRIEKEKMQFHENVRKGFHLLAQQFPQRIYRLDASKPPQEVASTALAHLNYVRC